MRLTNASVRAFVCVVVTLVSIVPELLAQSSPAVSFAWDPSLDPNVAGYSLYYGTTSGNYTGRVDAGNQTLATVSNLSPGRTYYFAITAYTAGGIESEFSNEVSFLVPGILRLSKVPLLGGAMQIDLPVATGQSYTVQASSDLRSWTTIWQTVVLENVWTGFLDLEAISLPRRFYRLLMD